MSCDICNKSVIARLGYMAGMSNCERCASCRRKYCYDCYRINNIYIRGNSYCSHYKGIFREYCSLCKPPGVLITSLNYDCGSKCGTCGSSSLFDYNKIHHKKCLFFKCDICNLDVCHDCKKTDQNNEILEKYKLNILVDHVICDKCIKNPFSLLDYVKIKCHKCKGDIKNDFELSYDDFMDISKCDLCMNMYCWDCGENELYIKKSNNMHMKMCKNH